MNLFLYIPAHSAHTPSTTKSLIYNLLRTYKRQNPEKNDFHNMGRLLFQRLHDRGHDYKNLKQLFKEILQKLNNQPIKQHTHDTNKSKTNTIQDNNLYLHLQYHPRGLSRRTIQATYAQTCTPNEEDTFKNLPKPHTDKTMKINKLTVAYSRPKNLRDIICPTTLQEYGNINVANISNKILSTSLPARRLDQQSHRLQV